MYIATQDFKSYKLGIVKKGEQVDFNKAWHDAGLIETKPESTRELETKPEPKRKKADK